MPGLCALLSAGAHRAMGIIHQGKTQQQRYFASPPSSPSHTFQKLQAIAGGSRIKSSGDDQAKQAPCSLLPPHLLSKGQVQKQKTKARARAQAGAPASRNGDFFTISMEPREWKDPFPAEQPCSSSSSSSRTTATRKDKAQVRGYTAAEAAQDYRHGACFAAWPIGGDGGKWRSVHGNMTDR